MIEMQFSEAFEILGIPETASETEIKRVFRERARTSHPDPNPGSTVDVGKLAEARDAALNYVANRTAIVKATTEVVSNFAAAIRREQQVREAAAQQLNVIHRHVNPLRTMRNSAAVCGLVSLLLSFVGDGVLKMMLMIPVTVDNPMTETRSVLAKAALWFFVVIAAIFSFSFNRRAESYIEEVDELSSGLSQADDCADALAEILGPSEDEIAEADLVRRAGRGLAAGNDRALGIDLHSSFWVKLGSSLLVAKIPSEESVRLLLLKAQEHGLVDAARDERGLPQRPRRYRVGEPMKGLGKWVPDLWDRGTEDTD